MHSIPLDLRFALRALRARPAFTLLAVLTLAIGIGASTAMYSVLYGVALAPLPYPEPDALVRLWESRQAETRDRVSPQNFVDWRAASHSFEAMSAFTYSLRTVGDGASAADAERLLAGRVTPGFFAVLRSPPMIGRGFADADGEVDGPPVVILGYALWQARFEGRRDALGRTLMVEGEPHEIIGILAADFTPPLAATGASPALFVPLRISPDMGRGGHWLRAIARLGDAAGLEAAQAEMDTIAARLEAAYPGSNTGRGVFVEPLHAAVIGPAGRALGVLVAAVTLVLVLACSNVAHLLLGRAVGRQREIAVRRALGAARGRLFRQLLTEGLLLASLGAGAGLLLAVWLVESMLAIGGDAIPRAGEIAISGPVLLVAGGLTAATAVLFGLVPALVGSPLRPFSALTGTAMDQRRRAGRLRSGLVVAEVAVAVVLLLAAGVLMRSFARLIDTPAGVDTEGVTVVEVALPDWQYPERAAIAEFYRQLLPAVRRAPGVRAAGAVNNIAFLSNSCDGFALDDRPPPPEGDEPCADNQLVTPGYFAAAGIPLVAGRAFDDRDDLAGAPVIVVNETMALRFWPGKGAVGEHVTYNNIRRRIVGITADVRRHGLAVTATPEMFIPHAQEAWETQMLVTVRGPVDAPAIVRDAVRSLDASVPVGQVWRLGELVDQTVSAPRFRTFLLAAFAAVALVLALVGLYGLMSFAVTARTRELGIRMALGARRQDVIGMILRSGGTLTVVGLAVGMLGALGLLRVLDNLLYETPALDPLVFAVVPLLFAAVALTAAYLPAARAGRLDPMTTLRHE